MEVLAPVGGREQLTAAVFSGADAVYLGTGNFNARRRADNFGGGSLKEAVAWCHGRGVRVHVTVNTLVRDRELPALFDTVKEVILLCRILRSRRQGPRCSRSPSQVP